MPHAILALDIGAKTIGLAVTDEKKQMVFPLPVLRYTSNEKIKPLFVTIAKILTEQNIQILLIGLPLNKFEKSTLQSKRIQHIVTQLQSFLKKQQALTPEIIFANEAYTTVKAHDMMRQFGVNTNQRHKVIDSMAAVLLLKTYLNLD